MSRFRDALDAWHGSHADFDEFRDDKINTGEGAQVYGHGHYVGEVRNTGKEYMENVSRKHGVLRGMYFTGPLAISPVVKVEDLVGAYDRAVTGGPSGTLRSRLRNIGALHLNDDELQVMMNALATAVDNPDIHPQEHIDYGLDHHQEILDSDPDGDDEETNEARTYIAAHPKITKIFENLKQATGGRLYQLKVDLSEPHVLDWDNTLADHHPESQARLKDHLGQLKSGTDSQGYNAYARGFINNGPLGVKLDDSITGDKLYSLLKTMHGGAPAASEALRKTGIHGIRYLDQFSRQKWSDWKNQVKPYDVTTVHGLVDKSGKADPKQLEEINKDIYDQSNVFSVKPRTLEDLISHIAREKLNHLSFSSTADYVQKEIAKYHKMLNWIAENQRNLDIHVETKRVTPSVEKPKDLTYNYVVFDPKLIKMVRKYDERGNVVHDYTQASGTELRPVGHDPFAEDKK